MFARYFLEVDAPFDEVEAVLLAEPVSWVPGIARGAGDRAEGLLAEMGFEVLGDRRLHREVAIEIGEARRSLGGTWLPMSWRVSNASRAFPSFEADLEVAAVGPSRTQLSISARYEPPMGSLGRLVDRAVLHRVAEATIKDFLDRVGAGVRYRLRAWAAK